MSPPTKNVLIFGPTGAVGRAAALEAHKRGAHVWLAMRNTSKEIPGISADAQGYTRIQADLSKPETLRNAVQQSGATTAFVYTLFDSPDAMRSSFDALKTAGIGYVALLSAFAVRGDAQDPANKASFVSMVHAAVEASLSVSGLKHAAVRPAYFNTNVLMYLDGMKSGRVDLSYSKMEVDYIAPEDIGVVCAAILTSPPQQNEIIPLCGPTLISQEGGISIIAQALGRDIKTREVSEDEWKESLKDKMPLPALDAVASMFREATEAGGMYPAQLYDEASKNVKKWSGQEPTSLAQWTENNRAAFA